MITTEGKHLIVDLWEVSENKKAEEIEEICKDAAIATGAEVLFSHFHYFPNSISSTGVIILSASHITWHSWFEKGEGNYLSLDVYVCGECDPEAAIDIFKNKFKPVIFTSRLLQRGIKPKF